MSDLNFEAGGTTPPTATTTPATTPTGVNPQPKPDAPSEADQLKIVYNGRELSQEEVLKKLEHADTHISTLVEERKADQARLEALEAAAADSGEIRKVLEALQGKPKDDPAKADSPSDAASVTEQVLATLAQRDAAAKADSNWSQVTTTLTKVYGEQTNAKVREVALANDMSVEEAASLAKSKPSVFLALFGTELKGSTHSTPMSKGTVNTHTQSKAPTGPSGYKDAKTTNDQVSIYKQRLTELGL